MYICITINSVVVIVSYVGESLRTRVYEENSRACRRDEVKMAVKSWFKMYTVKKCLNCGQSVHTAEGIMWRNKCVEVKNEARESHLFLFYRNMLVCSNTSTCRLRGVTFRHIQCLRSVCLLSILM